MAERMEKCAVHIPQEFVYYKTPMGDVPPYAKVDIGMPTIWAHLRPDIIEWIEANVRKKARITIRERWIPHGDPIITPGGNPIYPSIIDGKWLVFDDSKDTALFKMFWA